MKPDAASALSRVLVIDDEASFRQVIVKFLSKQGYQVAAAADGRAGVALAAETPPDLILCDLNMPGMDGYGVLAELRRIPRLADIPLIFLTGQSQPSQVRQGMNLGADDYLTKPVELEDLLAAVRVRLGRRQDQRQRQEQQMERAMQLFGSIVHDLRDPLFVVLGYTDMLRGGTAPAPGGAESSRQILERMQQAVLRMQAIVSETLFLARSRMQRLPFDPGPLDLREFCDQMVADYEERQRVRFECAAGRFPVTADALRLRQALDNLLSNALKYSDGPVVVRLSAGPHQYTIAVGDQGIGIPAAEQAGIFEPFFRASNTGSRPGHGLGLSIVKSCVEQHGGTVRFTSEAGKGTTFIMELPSVPPARAGIRGAGPERDGVSTLRPPGRGQTEGAPGTPSACSAAVLKGLPSATAPEAPAPPALAGPSPGKEPGVAAEGPAKVRGIIVDDDPLVRGLMRDLLEAGNAVLVVGEAGTVAQARLLVRQQGPEVVFLDVNLPDGSGFELLPDLRPEASVVFVTSAEEYAVHAFDCEATDFLLKPVTPERLQKALTRVRRRLRAKPAAAPASPKPADTFLVKTLAEKRVVKISEIDRVIAYGEYSWVYWARNKQGVLLRKSLKQWAAELPGEQFVRVHRRAIVNLAWLERVERLPSGRMQVHLRDLAEPIPVSLRLAPALNRKLKSLRA